MYLLTTDAKYSIVGAIPQIMGFLEEYVKTRGVDFARLLDFRYKPPVDLMKDCYFTWIKREKKAGGIKKRYLAKVTNDDLTAIHQTINTACSGCSFPYVYSYVEGKSAAGAASIHCGSHAIVGIDLKDYFFSISRSMIEAMYISALDELTSRGVYVPINRLSAIGLDKPGRKKLARAISILTTAPDPRGIVTDEAILPQGAVMSGMISNVILYPLDNAILEYCNRSNLRYSRYSDNIYISRRTGHISPEEIATITGMVESWTLAGKTPLLVNRKKTRYMPYWRQQRILGVVVNTKVSIPRAREKWFRAACHRFYIEVSNIVNNRDMTADERTGAMVQLKKRMRTIQGNLSYMKSIDNTKYDKYKSWLEPILMLMSDVLNTTVPSVSFDTTDDLMEFIRVLDKPIIAGVNQYTGCDLIIPNNPVINLYNDRNLVTESMQMKYDRVIMCSPDRPTGFVDPSLVVDPMMFVKHKVIPIKTERCAEANDIFHSLWKTRNKRG